MVLEIESTYGDMMIYGKPVEQSELNTIVKELVCLVGERDFTSAFCARFGYEQISYDENIKVDYTIDLDTHLVIKLKY